MTFKEKWIQDHPGEEFKVGYVKCPSTHGYRAKETVDDCKSFSCTECWDREILEIPICKELKAVGIDTPEKVMDTWNVLKKAGINPTTKDATALNAIRKAADASAMAGRALDKMNVSLKACHEKAVSTMAGILDSGDRTKFETGAVRDMREGKGRCDLMPLEVVSKFIGQWNDRSEAVTWNLSMFQNTNSTSYLYSALGLFGDVTWKDQYSMFLEVAKHFEDGAKKYGENNWQKGIPVHCYIDSAVRHYLKWLRGDKDEPHDRAFVWNIMCCIWEVDYHKKDTGVHNEDK